MSERYVYDDGGVWSGDPNEPPVSCNPPCVHDTQQDGVEFDCTDRSRLPWLAAALNASAQRDAERKLLEDRTSLCVVQAILQKQIQTGESMFTEPVLRKALALFDAALQAEVSDG